MEAADIEAQAIGRLAVYCMNQDAIPYRPMAGFWFVKGRVMGLKTTSDWDEYDMWGNHTGMDVLAPIIPTIKHLTMWADTIIRTPGVGPYLEACKKIRRYSQVCFPQEVERWLTIPQASKEFGMAERTLTDLAYARSIRTLIDDYGDMLVQDLSIKLWLDAVKTRQVERALNATRARTQKASS